MRKYLLAILMLLCPLCAAFAADVPGSKDPLEIKRYQGAEIVRFERLAFDRYQVPLGKMTKFDFGTKAAEFEKSEMIEGAVTRVSYRVPDAMRSSLEVVRNYGADLTASGWEILWRASGKQEYGNSFTHIYEALKGNDQLFTYNDAAGQVLIARNAQARATAVLFVTKFEMGLGGGVNVKKGEPIVQLDVIEAKPLEQKMVLVSSSEMEKSIGATGRVALYGIYFDFNSSALKAESDPTLEQIAGLLKNRAELKLLVVGHTDNVGGYDSNLRLSADRAAAVVGALTSRLSISPSRLKPIGVSFASPVASNETEEGRAKNRRVELVQY